MLFKIFNAEFEADMLDYDYMVKVEDELENVEKKIGEIKEKALMNGMRQSVLVKDSTEVIRHFFDSVFGDGAAQKIFGDRINYGKALEAFGEFVLQKNNHSGDDIKVINEKYTPLIRGSQATAKGGNNTNGKMQQFNGNGNRTQRRNSQKKKKNNNPNRYHK